MFCLPSGVWAGTELEVKRGKEATTYSITSEREEKNELAGSEKDKEKAWDMLRNSDIIIDRRRK